MIDFTGFTGKVTQRKNYETGEFDTVIEVYDHDELVGICLSHSETDMLWNYRQIFHKYTSIPKKYDKRSLMI